MRPIIRVKNLSKQYQIGELQSQSVPLTTSLARGLSAPFKRWRRSGHSGNASLWALKDVSFEVEPGEVVGVVGQNGAGKSTLLKIMSRITDPTAGRVELYGRVGSLLEVGTGFHQELTGRENIYLNGAILGMKRGEIRRRFDEIVAFAEIEKFLDTPVKYYSSGMYMRLAFAVAAHLDSDILLVDEVLAVGDADFQKKCLGKMNDVAQQGRTVLLVSHNMLSISRLCQRSIWIDGGRVRAVGPSEELISEYLLDKSSSRGQYIDEGAHADNSKVVIRAVRIRNGDEEISAIIDARKPFYIEFDYEVRQQISFGWLAFAMNTVGGVAVMSGADGDVDHYITTPREPGRYTSICQIPGNLFNSGRYVISAYVARTTMDGRAEIFVSLEHVLTFDIEHPGGIGSHMPKARIGIISPKLHWEVRRAASEELAATPQRYA